MALPGDNAFRDIISMLERELGRGQLTSDMKVAVNQAIEHYSNERFEFNYGSKDITLASADLAYSLSVDIIEIERFELSATGKHITLAKETWDDVLNSQFDAKQAGGTVNQGAPVSFAVYHGQAHFDIALDKNYNAHIWYKKFLRELSEEASFGATNAWINQGERMIKEKALQIIYENRLKNQPQAAIHELRAESARKALKKEVHTTDKIKPTDF